MSSEWPILRIEDVAERVGMGPFGSSIKVETFVDTGIPIISGEHLHDISLTEARFRFITEAHADQLAKANVTRGDIVFTHAGSIGQVAVIPEDSKFSRYVLSQRQFFMRCNRSIVEPLYIAYYFRSPEGRHKLLANASQVGVPSIARPVTYLRSIELPIPPLHIQREIVEIIEALRDRITLLRETNATLEAIAQALFKSWFVDFDPVRAKMEGRAPEGMDEETAALFPDSLESAGEKELPYGWIVGTLGSIARTRKDQLQPRDIDPSFRYVGLEHVPRRSLILDAWGKSDELASAKLRFRENDVLFGKLRPYFHKVVIAPIDGVCSTDILVCEPNDPDYYGLMTMYLFSDELVSYTDRLSNGAKMPRANWKDLAAYEVAVPPSALAGC